jgi:hypothetical protein
MGVILSVQEAAFVREPSQAKKTHAMMQWQAPHVVGKVFCVGAKGKETAAWQAVIN